MVVRRYGDLELLPFDPKLWTFLSDVLVCGSSLGCGTAPVVGVSAKGLVHHCWQKMCLHRNASYNVGLPSSKLVRGRQDRSLETVFAGYGISLVRQNCLPGCSKKTVAVECSIRAYTRAFQVNRQVGGG